MLKILSFACLLLAIFFFSLSGYWIFQRFNSNALSFSEIPDQQFSNISQKNGAVALSIDEASIKYLPIYIGEIKNNKWPLRSDGLIRLSSTSEPGNKGNSVIYGHNWKNIFGNLLLVKPGQIVKIHYSDGTSKNFEVAFTQVVSSEQTQILKNTDDTRLTLYTCTGFLDTKRFVVVANLLE